MNIVTTITNLVNRIRTRTTKEPATRPNGFAAHAAIHDMIKANITICEFFDLDSGNAGALHITREGWLLTKDEKRVLVVNYDVLLHGEGSDVAVAIFDITQIRRRSDLVYLQLEACGVTLHTVMYGSQEIRDPEGRQSLLDVWDAKEKQNDAAVLDTLARGVYEDA